MKTYILSDVCAFSKVAEKWGVDLVIWQVDLSLEFFQM
jgi:hypothetical protein